MLRRIVVLIVLAFVASVTFGSSARAEPVHFDVGRRDAATMFHSAERSFEKSLDPARLRAQLKDVKAGKQPSAAELRALKLVRKDGAILRGSFVTFGKGHEAPPKLDAFVTKFGKLNDALASKNADKAAVYARKVLKALDERAMKKELRAFEPASRKSFDKYLGGERERLAAGLEKGTMKAPEFHELRKSLTKILGIMTVAPDLRKDPAVQRFYERVLAVQTDMGLMHDDLAARGMRKEIDYERADVTLPPKMRAELRGILDALR